VATRDKPLPPAPVTDNDNDLRAAVGVSLRDASTAPPRRTAPAPSDADNDDRDARTRRRNPRTIAVAVASLATGLGIAVLVLLGRVNSGRFLLACEAERAVPQQGRSFPPWGTRALDGDQWRPLKIAAETRCQPHETDDELALARSYLAMVIDQATTLLTAREVTRLDDAEVMLKQALLLTRPPTYEAPTFASERAERHQQVERLLGDALYWRATARLRDAVTALGEAARQFDSAAAQQPGHVRDAAAWASYASKLAEQLQAGPSGTPPWSAPALAGSPPLAGSPGGAAAGSSAPTPGPAAPAGVALPVEPGQGSAAVPATPPPDAGVPTGGVLL
jgi:hypothetical protein